MQACALNSDRFQRTWDRAAELLSGDDIDRQAARSRVDAIAQQQLFAPHTDHDERTPREPIFGMGLSGTASTETEHISRRR